MANSSREPIIPSLKIAISCFQAAERQWRAGKKERAIESILAATDELQIVMAHESMQEGGNLSGNISISIRHFTQLAEINSQSDDADRIWNRAMSQARSAGFNQVVWTTRSVEKSIWLHSPLRAPTQVIIDALTTMGIADRFYVSPERLIEESDGVIYVFTNWHEANGGTFNNSLTIAPDLAEGFVALLADCSTFKDVDELVAQLKNHGETTVSDIAEAMASSMDEKVLSMFQTRLSFSLNNIAQKKADNKRSSERIQAKNASMSPLDHILSNTRAAAY